MATKTSKKKGEPLEENQPLADKIGKRIVEIRIKRGFRSSEQFAFTVGIDRAQWRRWERGTGMNIASLEKVLAALQVTADEFFRGL